MKRRGFTVLELIIVLMVIGILAAIIFPMLAKPRNPGRRSSCQSNLKQVAIGVKQYIQDNDDLYPAAVMSRRLNVVGNPKGWADAIQPYVKSIQIYQCPNEATTQPPADTNNDGILADENGYTDYWYNRNLSGASEKKLTFIANTILAGDGNDGIDVTDARYSKFGLPADWLTDKSKPSFRHLDCANYAFADGHVKCLKPEKITNNKPDPSTYTFVIK
jgi:prepilin-type N-terminal cleavage/methylation domain-containing protein/prepilin-type processing-associated H-X9-DG protein